jgi:dihydrofolate reductase
MTVSIIVAIAKNRVIGRGNALPWHISEDLKRFKKLTMGHPVIMGRKTFDSIGKPLPGRKNVILSRDRNLRIPGAEIAHTWEEAVKSLGEASNVFVLGGADLFRLALPKADRLYLTLIEKEFEGDTFFPDFDWRPEFDVIEETTHETPDGIPYRFVTAVRKGS